MQCSPFVVVCLLFTIFFLEVERIHLVNGTSSRNFGVDFNIDIHADFVRASMNENRLLCVVS